MFDGEAVEVSRVDLPPAAHRLDDLLGAVAGPVSAAVVVLGPVAEPKQHRRRCIFGNFFGHAGRLLVAAGASGTIDRLASGGRAPRRAGSAEPGLSRGRVARWFATVRIVGSSEERGINRRRGRPCHLANATESARFLVARHCTGTRVDERRSPRPACWQDAFADDYSPPVFV